MQIQIGQPEPLQDGWGQPISAERQIELQAMLDAWNAPGTDHGNRKGPFDGVRLSGAGVSWLAEQSGRREHGEVPNLHLEGAVLGGTRLEGASLFQAHLERANLLGARMEGADLRDAHLEGAYLFEAHLERADLAGIHLEGADLLKAHLEGANLASAQLDGASLVDTHLEEADLRMAYLGGADFRRAHLEGAFLAGAFLGGVSADDPYFQGIRQQWAPHLPSVLPPTSLRGAFLDGTTDLTAIGLRSPRGTRWAGRGPFLADIHWGSANLIVADWEPIATLADEQIAGQTRNMKGMRKSRQTRTDEYRAAGRAYRLLSVALRAQGLSTDATRYHFRAELMDRKALFHRRAFGRWLFSWLLGTFAGYGDRLGRLFLTYGITVGGFALVMLWFAVQVKANQPISLGTLRDVLVLSVTSFHGRGIQPPGLHLDDALATMAGAEAVFGLLIEGLFIAAFTRRVTGG